MACQRIPGLFQSVPLRRKSCQGFQCLLACRDASTFNGMTELSEDVDPSSSMHIEGPSEEHIKSFDPIARTKRRERQLPSSRSVSYVSTLYDYSINSPPNRRLLSYSSLLLTYIYSDTATAPQNTTAVPCTLTNPLQWPPPHPASTPPAPSPSPASSKPTTVPSPQTF